MSCGSTKPEEPLALEPSSTWQGSAAPSCFGVPARMQCRLYKGGPVTWLPGQEQHGSASARNNHVNLVFGWCSQRACGFRCRCKILTCSLHLHAWVGWGPEPDMWKMAPHVRTCGAILHACMRLCNKCGAAVQQQAAGHAWSGNPRHLGALQY
jgi:hypothetical protein